MVWIQENLARSPGQSNAHPYQGYTYTIFARSSGFSGCSGKTGCGGSLLGTHPKDLLIAWLSFFAGDFCVKVENKEVRKIIPSNAWKRISKEMVTRAVEHNFPRKLHSIITHVHGLCRKAPTAAPGRLWPFISGFLSTLCSHSTQAMSTSLLNIPVCPLHKFPLLMLLDFFFLRF